MSRENKVTIPEGIKLSQQDSKIYQLIAAPSVKTPDSAVFKYVDYLKTRAPKYCDHGYDHTGSTIKSCFNLAELVDEESNLWICENHIEEFYNKCHSAEDGTFCETPGTPGHEGHTTAAEAEADAAAQAEDEYRGGHQPPRDAPTIDNLLVEGGLFGPDSDVYENPQFFDHTGGESKADREAAAALRKAKGNPDVKIKVYRAAPSEANSINKGDWVTTSPTYAKEHAERMAPEGEPPWPVFEVEVPAKFIRNGGNDIVEWGFWAEDTPAKIVS